MAYEDLVRTFWRTYRPGEVERMGNTALEEFVQEKALEVEEAINDLADELAPRMTEGTTLSERAGQLKQARFEARASVLQELVYGIGKEPGTEEKDMPRVYLPPLDG